MVSVPWVSGPCADPRLPAVHGEWAVGCSGMRVDRAQNLRTGQQLVLERPEERVAVGPGVVYGKAGQWRLEEGGQLSPALPLRSDGALATDGTLVAVATEHDVQVGPLDGNSRQHASPPPAPWYRPAVADGRVAWVSHEGDSEDIWLLDVEARDAQPVAEGPGHERHVALSGTHIAWVEDDAVVLKPLDGAARRIPADAHTARGLALDGDVVCWEQWNGADVDVACSDGVSVQRPGHQRSPSRSEGWLMVVEDGQALVMTL